MIALIQKTKNFLTTFKFEDLKLEVSTPSFVLEN